MSISKTFGGYFSLFLGAALFALVVVVGTLSAQTVLAQPVDAGKEPPAGPIVYDLTPSEGAIVARNQLSRAAATIETQRKASLSWAGIFVDGRRRPSTLMGPTSYLQSVSADIGDLRPGVHTVRVIAVDSKGRAGGYAWTFTVV
ncbi:MAG: hypothetical protein M3246_07100 [Actinomycetota bacterium]|nr:hypothetical protein [Actinomycetota bacterium]HZY57992.1 hypothetical protein [Rubrobacteraceae bacterium]